MSNVTDVWTPDQEITRLVELYQEHRSLARQLEAAGHPLQAQRNMELARDYLRAARDRAMEVTR